MGAVESGEVSKGFDVPFSKAFFEVSGVELGVSYLTRLGL